jgi:hypothetical protein
LNKKLGNLRRDTEALESLASTFGQATVRAEESIGKLRSNADNLQESIEKAQALRDDLAFLIDRGGSAADRLEETVRNARTETGYTPQTVEEANKRKEEEEAKGDEPKSEAERELLKALNSAR